MEATCVAAAVIPGGSSDLRERADEAAELWPIVETRQVAPLVGDEQHEDESAAHWWPIIDQRAAALPKI